jgi:hypothetical protein
MGNCASKGNRRERNRNENNDGGEEGINLPSYPRPVTRIGEGSPANRLSASLQAQTQAPPENAPREVDGADFNRYMSVERIEVEPKEDKSEYSVGHNVLVTVHVRNNTSESLNFITPPPLEWKETIRTTEGSNGQSKTEEFDQYAKNSRSGTFVGWRMNWQDTIPPHGQKAIFTQDNPTMSTYIARQGEEKEPRTCSRTLDFDIGLPGSETRLKATQNIEIKNAEKIRNEFQIH